jgi:hypothetical protein
MVSMHLIISAVLAFEQESPEYYSACAATYSISNDSWNKKSRGFPCNIASAYSLCSLGTYNLTKHSLGCIASNDN